MLRGGPGLGERVRHRGNPHPFQGRTQGWPQDVCLWRSPALRAAGIPCLNSPMEHSPTRWCPCGMTPRRRRELGHRQNRPYRPQIPGLYRADPVAPAFSLVQDARGIIPRMKRLPLMPGTQNFPENIQLRVPWAGYPGGDEDGFPPFPACCAQKARPRSPKTGSGAWNRIPCGC